MKWMSESTAANELKFEETVIKGDQETGSNWAFIYSRAKFVLPIIYKVIVIAALWVIIHELWVIEGVMRINPRVG
jgi:hypothetical protein